MARTLAQIQQQIETLQQEAEKIKAKEVAGVIDRIKAAIDFYSLTPNDLFVTQGRPPGRPKKASVGKARKPAKKSATAIKFKDEVTGKTWTGHGRRPDWFIQAIESGKSHEDLAVKL